jgi:hypothetical protein
LSLRDWDEAEVRATVEDYLDMLDMELRGQPCNKADHRRQLLQLLRSRTGSAVERKHMNISAVLRDAGLPFIEGYKPLGNYQGLLTHVVHERLSVARSLLGEVERISNEAPRQQQPWREADPSLEVPRPDPVVREKAPGYMVSPPATGRINYAERDAANRKLGESGERFIFEVEKRRLIRAGRDDLVKKVCWISRDVGDGAGYDIRSFDPSGAELLVEVKTTNLHRRFPFIVTRNEVKVSEQAHEQYRLYRLFKFARDPHFFVLPGALSESCSLEARSYTANL